MDLHIDHQWLLLTSQKERHLDITWLSMEVQNTTYKIVLPEIQPEWGQAFRFIHKFI